MNFANALNKHRSQGPVFLGWVATVPAWGGGVASRPVLLPRPLPSFPSCASGNFSVPAGVTSKRKREDRTVSHVPDQEQEMQHKLRPGPSWWHASHQQWHLEERAFEHMAPRGSASAQSTLQGTYLGATRNRITAIFFKAVYFNLFHKIWLQNTADPGETSSIM